MHVVAYINISFLFMDNIPLDVLLHLFPVDGHLSFRFLAIMNSFVNIHVHVFISPRSGIIGLCGNYV